MLEQALRKQLCKISPGLLLGKVLCFPSFSISDLNALAGYLSVKSTLKQHWGFSSLISSYFF